jgi:uncharacterized membrane protein
VAFCSRCGTNVNDGVAFCPQCGAGIGVAPPPPQYQQYPPQYAAAPPVASGLQENVAGLLSYLLGWLTGIIFLLIDKRPFVRFHAAQSIVVFGFLFLIRLVLIFAITISGSFFGFWAIYGLLSMLVSLLTLAAWVVLMIMAYQGKLFEVPIAAGIARNIAGKVQ